MIGRSLILFLSLQLLQGLAGASDIQVSSTYMLVNTRDDVSIMCKLNSKLESCRFLVAGKGYLLRPNKQSDGISYLGSGLENGECGITIHNIEEKHNGNITCSLALDNADPTEQSANIRIVVAVAPQKPILEVSVDSKSRKNHEYQEGDRMTASCAVPAGRPAANITWFLGEEKISDGLRQAVEVCNPQVPDICTIKQNMTRTLQGSDDKKILRCAASHFALKGREFHADYNINVNYPPKLPEKRVEVFGLVEGTEGRVSVIVEANPKPVVIWTVGSETIHEGVTVGRYTVLATQQLSPGKYLTVLIIDNLTNEDTLINYMAKAHNELGEAQYDVVISTYPEPKVTEIGAGLIIVITAAILLILLILGGILFARAKGLCCFAGGNADKRVNPTSEGTENPAVNHTPSTEYITNSPQLKKEKPKEDTPV